MTAPEAMTAAELRVYRELAGLLSSGWLPRHFGLHERTGQRWERAENPVPDRVKRLVQKVLDDADYAVNRLVDQLRDHDNPVIYTAWSDADMRRLGSPHYPPPWHQMVAARAARQQQQLHGRRARIYYLGEKDQG